MQCPVCGKEMKTGASTFMGSTGLTPMACVFTDSEVKQKGFFRHNVVSKVLLQGDDIETYFCESCQLLLPRPAKAPGSQGSPTPKEAPAG